MERDEFKTLTKAMKAVYPGQSFIPDQDAFAVWYALLKDMPYEVVSAAIQKHMMTSRFAPTIAEIREAAADIASPAEMSEMEAWSMVYRAICNLRWDAPELEFNKLPELCRAAVGTPANLREMATMNTETVLSVEQSHFLRNYRAAKDRKRADDMLSLDLKSKIDEARQLLGDTWMAIEDKED